MISPVTGSLSSKIEAALLYAFLATFWLLPLLLFSAWVRMNLWLWFVTPVFGLVPISVAQAFGLSLFLRSIVNDTPPNDERSMFLAICLPFLRWALVLAVGFVASWFV